VEPKIGHAKHEHRPGRCCLKGLEGDAMNVLLTAAGANLAKLPRRLPSAVRAWVNRWKITLYITTARRPPPKLAA